MIPTYNDTYLQMIPTYNDTYLQWYLPTMIPPTYNDGDIHSYLLPTYNAVKTEHKFGIIDISQRWHTSAIEYGTMWRSYQVVR